MAWVVVLGIFLEALHGFKIGWYLNVDVSNRRTLIMWTHGLGGLLALLNILFAAYAACSMDWVAASRAFASQCLVFATVFLPCGLMLAGVFLRDGRPGQGIALSLAGLVVLVLAVLSAAKGQR